MDIDGADRVIADLTRAGLTAGMKAAAQGEISGRRVRDQARQLAPKTGLPHYARAITYEVTVDKTGTVDVEIGPERGGQGSLGHILEFGTVRTPPHAHLSPALDREGPEWVKSLGDIGNPFT